MASKKPDIPTLTKAEEEIMQALWGLAQPALVRSIINNMSGKAAHANTINTLLKILTEKGFVRSEQVGAANQYYALITKEDYSRRTVKTFVQRYFDGSYSSLVSFFAKDKNLSVKDLEMILESLKAKKD